MAISPRKVEADDSAGIKKVIQSNKPMIDEVPQGADYKELFRSEAFMNEVVTIMLHPSMDPSEIEVPVSVNGNRVSLKPNIPSRVRRYHVAQLLKARPDIVSHRSDDYSAPEAQQNRLYRQSTSRYNFDVVEDTAKGAAWLRELRQHYVKK